MDTWVRDYSTALKIMDGHGLTEGFGHLSTRLDDGCIAITPAMGPGMSAESATHILFTDTGDRVDESDLPAPLETSMHLAIYAAREDVNAICRTHSPAMVSYGVLGWPLPTTHGFGLMLGDRIPFHWDGDLIYSLERAELVASALGSSRGLLLKGNGGLCVGASIPEAVVRAIYLEEAARIALDTNAADSAASNWTEAEKEKRRKWHEAEAARAWSYYAWKYR